MLGLLRSIGEVLAVDPREVHQVGEEIAGYRRQFLALETVGRRLLTAYRVGVGAKAVRVDRDEVDAAMQPVPTGGVA